MLTHDERREMLARDALASVDGFRALVMAAYEHLFGLRVCVHCPDCNNGEYGTSPCQDLFGSNAMSEGGVFGRIDAGYTSIEAQKSTGSLHAHSQLFVQCLHQHTPLAEIMHILRSRCSHLVQDYLVYKGRVCRQVYARTYESLKQRLHELGKQWPEYSSSTTMISRPEYLRRRDTIRDPVVDGARKWIAEQTCMWAETYLGDSWRQEAKDWVATYLGWYQIR